MLLLRSSQCGMPSLLAIAVHGVSDVRPVLDSYKAEGDENVLQVFKTKQVYTTQY